jgi:hypothetical protein
MIFFHDKHWFHSEPLFTADDEHDEDENDDEENENQETKEGITIAELRKQAPSPVPSQATVTSAPGTFQGKKPEYEFLLFNYLLRFVHREGQIGDFARAGLLFLMDVAMSPGEPTHKETTETAQALSLDPITEAALALAEYILDGDFSEVLGAGLGAVYSLLPSKLEFRPHLASEMETGSAMVIGSGGPETEEDKEREEAALERNRALGVEDASNPDFKSRLDHFLKLLEFIQDVLRRNVVHDSGTDPSSLVGTAIVQSILDAVRRIFLENVLYPSVLECSDNDGSAIAVMSYIEIMIRTLEDGPLSDLLINFLMSEDNEGFSRPRLRTHSTLMLGAALPFRDNKSATLTARNKLRKRKSSAMALLEMEAPDSNKQSEYFTSMGRFTLKDLLLSNLRSNSQSTGTAALHLLRTLLSYHSRVERLLVVISDPIATSFPEPAMLASFSLQYPIAFPTKTGNGINDDDDDDDDDDAPFVYPGADVVNNSAEFDPDTSIFIQPRTTYYTHEREMGLYLTLISRVDPSHNGDSFSTGYDHYLRDALLSIQGQRTYQVNDDGDMESRTRLRHRLNVNDPILTLVLEALRTFFSNIPEFNVALTGVLAALAINPNRSLAGWLTCAFKDTPDARNYSTDTATFNDDGDDRSIDFRIEENLAHELHPLPASSLDEQSRPVVHSIFHALVAQLERYRQQIDGFDKFLLERRQGLLFNENLTDALTLALDFGEDTTSGSGSRTAQGHLQHQAQPPPKSKPSPSSFFANLLTPKKKAATTSALTSTQSGASDSSTPNSNDGSKAIAASPFGPHYQRTSTIVVEPFVAPVPVPGTWTAVKNPKWSVDEEDVFSSTVQWGGDESRSAQKVKGDLGWEGEMEKRQPTRVTLSRLLDNVVVLEESIKELAAIVQARRSLGIDSVRYL